MGIAALVIVIFVYSVSRNEVQCGYDANLGAKYNLVKVSEDACDKSCRTDSDCQPFVGSCINSNEKPYFPEGLSVAVYSVNCYCENLQCVGKPTGELAI